MIMNIVFSVCFGLMFYKYYTLNKKVLELTKNKTEIKEENKTKDPYKDWRDPSTGLLKSKKNTMI
jgi:hypothetical protein